MQRKRRKTPVWLRTLKESGLVYGFGALLVAMATWVTFQFIEPAPPRTLSIATGSSDGAYQFFSQRLRRELAKHEVELIVIETDGSVDNLQRLAGGEVDVAFLQSGLARPTDYPALESLGSMYFEPVWIFTRSGFSINSLNELAGKTIAVGGAGSGSRLVAAQLLKINELDNSDVILSDVSGMQAVASLVDGSVDALFSVASVSAPMISALLGEQNVQLANLRRAPAYARREPWLTHLELPEGVINLAENIPASSINLLSVKATLIATEELHPALRDLLLQAADTVFSEATVLSAADEFPNMIGADFKPAPEAERYYESGPPFLQRYLPFWVANLVDRLKLLALPLVALLLPLSRLLPPAYRWSVRKKIYRWYEQVQNIDQSASDDSSEDNIARCSHELMRIEGEVREVEVPLAYAHELYVLRQHIALLHAQIEASPKGASPGY